MSASRLDRLTKCGTGSRSIEISGCARAKWASCGARKKEPKPSVEPIRTCPESRFAPPLNCSLADCTAVSISSA